MNIKFVNVKINNFFSYEHAEVDLSNIGFAMVKGINNCASDNAMSNGSGKSTIFNAICWALVGETLNGISTSIENIFADRNNCNVELEFYVNNDLFKVVRYKTPKSNLKLFINGEDKSGKGIKETEKLLSEYLPDLTSDLISSIIILGQGMPNKFSDNKPAKRKEVLESLTKTDYLIVEVKEKIANRIDELKMQETACNNSIIAYETKIESNKKWLESQKQTLAIYDNLEDRQPVVDRIEENTNVLNSYNNTRLSLVNELNLLSDDEVNKCRDKYYNLMTSKADVNTEILGINREILLLNSEIFKIKNASDTCPTCGQKLNIEISRDTSTQDARVAELTKNKNELSIRMQGYSEEADVCSKELQRLSDELSNNKIKINEAIGNIDKQISDVSRVIQEDRYVLLKIDEQIKAVEAITNTIKTIENDINDEQLELIEEQAKLTNINNHLSVVRQLDSLAKRDFRGILLDNVIRCINTKVQEYSEFLFGSSCTSLMLDGNNISIMFNDKPYENLSGGEKQKIDILIQLSIRSVLSEQLDIHSNMLVVDEIFDNLDAVGCNKVIDLISTIDDIDSMFIISHHADTLNLPVDREVVVTKGANCVSSVSVV